MIARKIIKNLKDTTIVTFLKAAGMMGYKIGEHYTYNQNDMVITWKNGSKTIFKEIDYNPSDPDFQRLGGLEVTDAFIDEAAEVTEKAFDILQSRIRWMLAEYKLSPKILMTCNPGYNWIRTKYIKDEKNNPIVLPVHQVFVPALVDDNPDSDFVAIYKAGLQAMNSDYDKRRLLYGDWDAVRETGGNFYKAFRSNLHTSELAYNDKLPLHVSFDFNVVPHMTCTIWQVVVNGEHRRLCQIDEICLSSPHNSTAATCRELASRYRSHQAGLFIYGDPAGNHQDTRTEGGSNDYTIIRRELAGFRPTVRVERQAPPVVGRGQFMNAMFSNEVAGLNIVIGTGCVKTIADYSNLKEATEGGKDKRKVTDPKTNIRYEPYGHCSDANDYLICTVLAKEFTMFMTNGSRKLSVSKPVVQPRMGW